VDVRYYIDPETTPGVPEAAAWKGAAMSEQRFPAGWDEKRVKALLAREESLSEDEQMAEDEAGLEAAGQAVISVPTELLPAIRRLLAMHKSA